MPLILRSTFASSCSNKYCDADVEAGTSIACGWRWPTGAVQGLVVVSFPAGAGWKDCDKARTSEVGLCARTGIAGTFARIATVTRILEFFIGPPRIASVE